MMARDILRNIKHYAASLHAKVIRKQAGHGRSSQKELLTLGRRLTSPDFLFSLAGSKTLWQHASGHLP